MKISPAISISKKCHSHQQFLPAKCEQGLPKLGYSRCCHPHKVSLTSWECKKQPSATPYGQGNRIWPQIAEWRESHLVVSDSLQPHGLYSPWNSPGQNTGVGNLSLLPGIFLTQELNSSLRHCRLILYQLGHKGSPRIMEWVAYSFSRVSSWPRNHTRASCISGTFFTNWAMREIAQIAEMHMKGMNSVRFAFSYIYNAKFLNLIPYLWCSDFLLALMQTCI